MSEYPVSSTSKSPEKLEPLSKRNLDELLSEASQPRKRVRSPTPWPAPLSPSPKRVCPPVHSPSGTVSEPRFSADYLPPSASPTVGGRSITGHIEDRDDFVTGTMQRRHYSEMGLNAPREKPLGDDMGCDEKRPEKDPPVPPDPTGTGTITGDVLRSLVFAGVFLLVAYFIVEERDYARPLRV